MSWLFRNRRTGEITVFQAPNATLAIWLVATIANVVFDPSGTVGTVITVVATIALVIWAGDELLRGVNPFRRALGAIVLVYTVAAVISR